MEPVVQSEVVVMHEYIHMHMPYKILGKLKTTADLILVFIISIYWLYVPQM
jgi:hypothetical protein